MVDPLVPTPEERARIDEELITQRLKIVLFNNNLPSRAAVKTAINAAFLDPKQNAIITKLADVVYWLAKNSEK